MKALAIFSRKQGPLAYEVRLEVESGLITDYDDWLRDHVRAMLAFPGFQAATIYRGTDLTDEDRALRVVTYEVRSQRELDSYLHTHARRMRRDGEVRFGKGVSASRRILPLADYEPPAGLPVLYNQLDISGGLPICSNCHQPVAGRFCTECGQEDRTFLLSLGELVYDFVGDIFNFDSRFFRTMRPLLLQPGALTVEYIRGRRQHYLPPVRLYIFISLVFFFLAALLTDLDFGDSVNAQLAGENGVQVEGVENLSPEERAEVEARLRETEQQLGLPSGLLKIPGNAAEGPEEETDDASTPAPAEGTEEKSGGTHINAGPGSIVFNNGEVEAHGFGSEDIDDRLERGARSLQRDPKAFARAVMQQIPSMMFLFLPVIALVLKFLYIGSGRYYVEHLIFTLHFHSAVFVMLLLWLLVDKGQVLFAPVATLAGWLGIALAIYLPYYLFRSLRVVYGQGRFVTSLKLFILNLAYFIAAVTMLVLTLLYTLFMNA